ncbi:MAG: arginine deiminase family protein [Cyclobacteriaceae bacterium]
MVPIKIIDEIAPLEAVVLGTAKSFGGVPALEETYDPKSREHINKGTFPAEEDLVYEMDQFRITLEKYGVKVFRPKIIENYNQVFSRDICFAIDDCFVIPRVTENRRLETDGIQYIIDDIEPSKVLLPDLEIRIEGGDVMPWNGKLFVGYSKPDDFNNFIVARTNEIGVEYLQETFKDWEVIPFELKKSDHNPKENALHLDCCFQPLGKGKAIIHREGFKNQVDVDYLIKFFGEKNIHFIDKEEMYQMHSNVFSINPEVVVSDKSFTRLNDQLRTWGFTVEEVPYQEVAKMEGLLRCTTMPLRRNYD